MYYFIGIKGTGMASLAIMLKDLGYEVKGSDQEKHFFTEDELVEKGIEILPFDPDNIKEEYTVIIGNAFLEDFPEVIRARQLCECYRYHEFLGKLMEEYKVVTISGSHGKTTTTTMAKTIISRFEPTGYLIGKAILTKTADIWSSRRMNSADTSCPTIPLMPSSPISKSIMSIISRMRSITSMPTRNS